MLGRKHDEFHPSGPELWPPEGDGKTRRLLGFENYCRNTLPVVKKQQKKKTKKERKTEI